MKKSFFSLLLLFAVIGSGFPQGIYLRAGGGYGFPIATSSIGEKYFQTYDNTVSTYSAKNVKGSYGAGFNFNFALGYKFNENFIFEISSQYLFSNKYETYNKYSYTNPVNPYVDNIVTKTSARALFVNPSFVFSAGFGNAAPYGRFGVIFGSPQINGQKSSYYNGDGVDSSETKWRYSKGISFGFQGAIGMNWRLSEKMDFYTEINYVSMTYYPGQYDLTMSNSNGYDNLPNMYLSQKQTIFKKEFDPYNSNSDPTKPKVDLPQATPFSSLSLQVGIRYSLWKKKN
jgi:hypothetical protein